MISRFSVVLVVTFLTACGGDDGTGVSFETLAGTYVGPLIGTSQGVILGANLSVTITQSSGSLSGSYAISGTLTEGAVVVAILGTGSFTGTIAAGLNPSVNLTLTNQCPNYSASFSGALDSANNLLTISGPVHVLDSCTILLTYQSTLRSDGLRAESIVTRDSELDSSIRF